MEDKLAKSVAHAQSIYTNIFDHNNNENADEVRQSIISIEKRLDKYSETLIKVGIKEGSKCYPLLRKTWEVKANIENNRYELDEPFLLFVMGIGNAGKSTLVNTLLEAELAPTDYLPLTWKIDKYQGNNGKEGRCKVDYRGDGQTDNSNKSREMTRKKAMMLLETEEKRLEREGDRIEVKYDKEASEYEGDIYALIDVNNKKIEELESIKSDINQVTWNVKENEFLSKYTIVDTPGLVQKRLGTIVNSASDYYNNAEGVIWIIAGEKLTQKEQINLIKGMSDSGDSEEEAMYKNFHKAFKNLNKKAIGVVNHIDRIEKNGGLEAVERTMKQARELYGKMFRTIIPFSAKLAYEGIIEKNQEKIRKSGLIELKMEINRQFFSTAEQMKIQSKSEGLKDYLHELKEVYKSNLKDLCADSDKYKDNKNEINKSINEFKKNRLSKLENIIEEYKSDVKSNISRYAEDIIDESELMAGQTLKDRVFVQDRLDRELSGFENETKKVLEKLSKNLIEISTFKKYKYIEKYNYSLATINSSGHNITDIGTTSIDITASNLWAAGGAAYLGAIILGPVGLIAGGIAYALGIGEAIARRSKKNKIINSCEENLKNMCYKIKNDFENNIDKMAREIKEQAESNLKETFENLYLSYEAIDEFYTESNGIEDWIKTVEQEINLDFNIDVKKIILGMR